jgi:hypothetical protein
MLFLPLQRFPSTEHKPLKRLRFTAAHYTSLKRGVNENGHAEVADSFDGGCFADTGRAAATRRVAFLRRKYATRRLRFSRTRCCCPMHLYGLKIRETQSALKPIAFFRRCLMVFAGLPLRRRGNLRA